MAAGCDREALPADPALCQADEQVLRVQTAPTTSQSPRALEQRLECVPTCLHPVPQLVINDAQLGMIRDVPLLARLLSWDELVRAWSALVGRLAPNLFAAVAFVRQDSLNPILGPSGLPRRRDGHLVELVGDLRIGDPVNVPLVDLANDRGFLGIDLPPSPDDHGTIGIPPTGGVGHRDRSISVRLGPGVKPTLKLTSESSFDLVLQLSNVELVDDAVNGDERLCLFRGCIQALRDEHDPHAAERELLNGADRVSCIPSEPRRVINE